MNLFLFLILTTHPSVAHSLLLLFFPPTQIDDDADRFGVQFVSNSERAAAKKFGITTFPKLLFFKHKEPTVYEGDLMNEEQVLEWLTSIESMDLPDKIEEVTAKSLPSVIDNQDYVAVLFCKLILQQQFSCTISSCKHNKLLIYLHVSCLFT